MELPQQSLILILELSGIVPVKQCLRSKEMLYLAVQNSGFPWAPEQTVLLIPMMEFRGRV